MGPSIIKIIENVNKTVNFLLEITIWPLAIGRWIVTLVNKTNINPEFCRKSPLI